MATITMDPNFGYAILAATATFWLGAVHTANTGKHRKLSKVAYPAAYAPADRTDHAALCFNGAQRAHANYIENQVQTVPAILIAGLQYPRAAGIMGAAWCLSRFAYMVGYSKGLENGMGRYQKGGPVFWFAQLGLIGTATWVGVKFITGW